MFKKILGLLLVISSVVSILPSANAVVLNGIPLDDYEAYSLGPVNDDDVINYHILHETTLSSCPSSGGSGSITSSTNIVNPGLAGSQGLEFTHSGASGNAGVSIGFELNNPVTNPTELNFRLDPFTSTAVNAFQLYEVGDSHDSATTCKTSSIFRPFLMFKNASGTVDIQRDTNGCTAGGAANTNVANAGSHLYEFTFDWDNSQFDLSVDGIVKINNGIMLDSCGGAVTYEMNFFGTRCGSSSSQCSNSYLFDDLEIVGNAYVPDYTEVVDTNGSNSLAGVAVNYDTASPGFYVNDVGSSSHQIHKFNQILDETATANGCSTSAGSSVNAVQYIDYATNNLIPYFCSNASTQIVADWNLRCNLGVQFLDKNLDYYDDITLSTCMTNEQYNIGDVTHACGASLVDTPI